ncbi:hypothetical protein BpHYR1_037128 [Brachionus plicatilis]|uniref:Uncharacterized protein n=1 Tax=Brachionus plicatilis TaxID=10195 RepID=A0A3M7SYI2_BRAPC|nr:hypothetical protein BpHYR1_037128 [Brachionus plicatilis]
MDVLELLLQNKNGDVDENTKFRINFLRGFKIISDFGKKKEKKISKSKNLKKFSFKKTFSSKNLLTKFSNKVKKNFFFQFKPLTNSRHQSDTSHCGSIEPVRVPLRVALVKKSPKDLKKEVKKTNNVTREIYLISCLRNM